MVTGGNSGIGLAAARLFVAEGAASAWPQHDSLWLKVPTLS